MRIHRYTHSLGLAMLLGAALLVAHPYTGIRHDGILYLGDALNRLVPGLLGDDLYFRYGSQGKFTLLPMVYAAAIDALGIGSGTVMVLLIAIATQVAATIYMAGVLAPPTLRGAVALSVLLAWSIYGGLHVFAYGEPFLTARSFAEPFVIFGLAALWRGHVRMAVLFLAAALAVHPLMGLTGWLVAWVWLCIRDRRWIGAALPATFVWLILGWWGHAPFDDVFIDYDSTWLALIHEANPQAFNTDWHLSDYGNLAYALTVLWLAARRVEDARVASIAKAVAIAGIASVALNLAVVDGLHNPFFAKLQVWRILWVTQWIAMASVPLVVVALWRRSEAERIGALLLAIGWMSQHSVAPAFIAIAAVVLHHFGPRAAVTPATTRLVVALTIAAGVLIIGQHTFTTITLGLKTDQPLRLIIGQTIAVGSLVGCFGLFVLRLLDHRPIAGMAVTALLLVTALSFWDQRAPWTRRLESYPVASQIWADTVKPGARVYWYRDLIAPWVLLRHANYYTQQQSSGAVFSRDLIFELSRRSKLTGVLDLQEQICRMMNGLNEKQSSCEPDAAAVSNLCSDGGLDFVVLQSGLEGVVATKTFSTGIFENGYEKTFYLYRCSALKSG